MPYHSVDPFTNTKYKAIGNKSKNDFLPKTKSSTFNKIKKNKNNFYNHYDYDFVLVKQGILPQNTVTKVPKINKINNIEHSESKLIEPDNLDFFLTTINTDILKIIETDINYNIP